MVWPARHRFLDSDVFADGDLARLTPIGKASDFIGVDANPEPFAPTRRGRAGAVVPSRIEADLVLDYLKHPDLSEDLAQLCRRRNIPVIASGKKIRGHHVMTPPT